MHNTVLSKAHYWLQDHYSKDVVICEICGIKCIIGEWTNIDCFSHYESIKSGYEDDSAEVIVDNT